MTAFKRISHLFAKGERLPGEEAFQRGKTALGNNDFSLAASELTKAISLGLAADDLPEAYSQLGAAYFQLDQKEQAIAAYAKTVTLDPQSRKDWNNLGVSYWRSAKFDEAIHAHQQALKIDPNDAAAYCDLGSVYLSKFEPRLAIETLEKSIQLDPKLLPAHSNLAVAYAMERRFGDAYQSVSNAAELGYPDLCSLKYQIDLMKTCHILEGEDKKRSWLDLLEVVNTDPDHADMTSLRYAYALSEEYDPYGEKDGIKAATLETMDAVDAGDWQRVIETGTHVLALNYTVLAAHWMVIQGYQQTGQKEKALPHQQFFRAWMRSVNDSGFGRNYQTAYYAVSLDEESMFLKFFGAIQGYEYRGRWRLAEQGEHRFDVFDIYRVKEKQAAEIYFNVDMIFQGVEEGRAKQPKRDEASAED